MVEGRQILPRCGAQLLLRRTGPTRSASLPAARSRRAGLGDKSQRNAVVAVAQARRLGAVVEHVAVMAPAADAVVLGPREDQLEIALGAEHARDRGEEARPAGAAVVLHRRSEERQAAAGADEDAGAFLAVERARACALGPFLAQDVVLRGVEPFAPPLARQPQRLGRQRYVSVRGEQRLPVALQ